MLKRSFRTRAISWINFKAFRMSSVLKNALQSLKFRLFLLQHKTSLILVLGVLVCKPKTWLTLLKVKSNNSRSIRLIMLLLNLNKFNSLTPRCLLKISILNALNQQMSLNDSNRYLNSLSPLLKPAKMRIITLALTQTLIKLQLSTWSCPMALSWNVKI